jgi:hypothetical protein
MEAMEMELTMNQCLLRASGWMKPGLKVLLCVLMLGMGILASGQAVSTTTVQGTVYLANGQTGPGTLSLSWPAFTTAGGQAVTAGSLIATIGADGFVSVNLAPNLGSTPAGLYYTAIYQMSDGSTSTEYWVVPAAAQATIGAVRAQLMPAVQAVQTVSKSYVDQAIAEALGSELTVSGGNLTGPLYLSGDPTQPLQAADKHYVDETFALAVPLSGGNMTGPLQTPTLNGIQSPEAGSGQTTLQAAMSAAGSTGAMLIPPNYAGTDGFTNPNGDRVIDLRTTGAQQIERSVKEFGAVCDGVTDDTNALQTALNYAQAHGVALTIPQGTCKTHSLNWHGETIGGLGKQVSALMGFPGQDVLATVTDSPSLLAYTRLHDLTIYVDQSVDASCSPAKGRAPAGSCVFGRAIESNSIFSPGGNGLSGTKGTGAGWSVGNCAIAMPAVTGAGGNGLRVAEVENVEIATTGVDPMAAQYPGAHSTHTCGLYLAQWPKWSEFRNIDIRGVNTGIALPTLPGTVPAGLGADSNRWQNITIQATHGFAASAGSNNVVDNLVSTVGNSAATAEPPTGLVLDFPGQQNGWAIRNLVVMPTWTAVQPLLTVAAAGGAVTGVTVGSEHGLGFDPYGSQAGLKFSGSCTAQANAAVNSNGSIGAVTVTQGGVGCSATTTASVNVAGTWDTAAAVNLIGGQNITVLAGTLLNGNGGYTVWTAASSSVNGTQLDSGGGNLPGGGTYPAIVATNSLGSAIQVDQLPGADFGAKLQSCVGLLSASFGGTCDARNFTGTLAMGSNLTISTANAAVLLPCATISTANQVIVTAGTRNVSLRGCSLRGASSASGSQGGTAFMYSGAGAMVQVGDPTYATDTMGFHLDNVLINITGSSSATAQGLAAYRTQELDLESLYFLGNGNQTGLTLDGTGNYTGGTFFDNAFNGFLTAVNGIGHQAANPATTDWLNASTFVRLHIDCPTSSGSPVSGTTGVNLAAGDGNTITGGDVEGCSTALHLGPSAMNNTIVGLRNENSGDQIVADAGSQYNSWITGGAMFTGKLVDNGTHNSFWDAFHRSFNNLNGDLWRSQADTTITDHVYTGIGLGNVRGKLTEYQTDVPGTAGSYENAWVVGVTDGTTGAQFYQVADLLNNVTRFSVGQYNNGSSTNNQTVINAAGTGAVVLNGSNNAGTGGVVVGSGGVTETTVATISNAGNAQFNGTLLVGGTTQSTGTMTVRNNADAEVDYYLTPGLTTSQKGSFTYKDWNGASQWYMVKDASNNWALNSAIGGLDSLKAYQSTNSGDTYVDASNATGHVRLNYEAGSGAETDIYSGGSANLVAAFQGLTSIKFPGLAAASGQDCLQIDSSGFVTNTGSGCGSGSGGGSTNGTVNSGASGQIAYYSATGTAVSGLSQVPVASGGTGAATAVGALANLGAAALAGATFTGPVNARSFEGQLEADQWQSPAGTGNNGIAMSMAQCALQTYVCSIVAPALYAQVEAQPWGSGNTLEMIQSQVNGPKSTDPLGCVTDYRWGPPQVICNQGQAPTIGGLTNRYVGASPIFNQNVTTVGNGFSPSTPQGLSVFTHVFSGGRDSYLDEVNQTNLNTLMQSNTPGVIYDWQSTLNAFSPGDTIPIISRTYGVGASAGQNEGLDYHLRLGETGNVFEGTLNAVPSCGVTCTFAVTQTMGVGGGIGSGVPLIDITNGYNTGYVASIGGNSTLTGSGTNWTSLNSTTPTSSITTTTTNIDNGSASASTFPQTSVQVTVASASGFTATGNPIACLFSNEDLKWTCAHVTAVAGSVVTLDRVDFGFPAGSAIATGGLTGYGFGFDIDTVTSANMNGYRTASDQSVNGPIRQVYPVVGNTSATSLAVYLFSANGTRALINNGTATSNAYHLWPQALVLDAYNHATGALDGSALLTTPKVGAFAANDTVEQPHYFSVLVEGLNLAVNKFQATPKNASSMLSFNLGGNFISGDAVGRFNNLNDPTIYLGLPTGMQSSVLGRNVLTTPLGLAFSGPFQSALNMAYPPFGGNGSQQIGTIVQGCGGSPSACASWNRFIPIETLLNSNSAYTGISGEDIHGYNPATLTHIWTAGATGLTGGSPAASMSLSPNGLSVSNIAASNAPICPNGVNGALTTTGCAVGTGGGGLAVNNPTFTGALSGPLADLKATSNNIVYADQFSGATADVKIAAALAQACPVSGANTTPVTNGTVDARGLTGGQTIAATITMPPNCVLLLGVGTYTRASGAQILFDSGDTIAGANPGLGYTAQRATQIQGTAGDTTSAIAYRYGAGGGGGIGAIVKDLSIYGPTTGTGISFVHVQGSQINNVAVANVAVGLTMGFTGGCDCYNSFHEDQFFASGYGVQIVTSAYANQNQFYGGRYASSGSDAVYLGGVNNTFYSPDVEGSPTAFEFVSGGADTLYAPYFEANTTDVLFDSGAVGGAVIGGTNAHVTDNSGNTSNFVFTSGTSANQGGNTPVMFAAQTLRLGGNLDVGSNQGGDLSLVGGGADSGAQLLFSPQAQATYGRVGGLPLHIGSLYAAGSSSLNVTAVTALPNPAAPALTYTGTAGSTSYSYAVVCYTTGGGYNSMPSAQATINNAAATLSATNYVTITPSCGPGYSGAAILKGGTSGTVLLASSSSASPNIQGFNDTGQSLSAFAAISRNTTGDFSVAGYLNASQFSIGSNVVIPSTVSGYQGTSGTKVQLGIGSPTAGHCANFAADGSIQDAGTACVSPTSSAVTFANSAASQDYIILQPGTGATDQLGAFEFANYAGTSEWELRKDALEVFHLRDSVNGADRLLAYQGGQSVVNSAGSNAVVVNSTTGSGTGGFIVYGGGSSPAAALSVTSSGNTTAAGFISGKFYTGNSAMTLTAGAGAGTSPTITCATNCTGAQGTYSVTVGTSPAVGTLVTLNFPNTHTNTADCVGNLYLPGTGQVTNWEAVAAVSSLGVKVDGSALTAGSQYKFTYWCGGY